MLPRFAGSAWRGAFGHALKRTVCTMRLRPCASCILHTACVYPALFAPPAPNGSGMLAHADVLPPPYVLDPAGQPEQPSALDQRIIVTLRLFGTGTRAGAYALLALARAAENGIGAKRISLAPVAIKPAEPAACEVPWSEAALREAARPRPLASPPPMPHAVTVQFDTPLRLRLKNDLVTPDALRPAHVFGAAIRRASLLWRCHGPAPIEADFRALKTMVSPLVWRERALGWVESTRYSSRQNTTMQTGGILGTATLELGGLEPLWPFLWLGQFLHVGKNTTMGFGRYRLHAG
jgi:hypothetical protein